MLKSNKMKKRKQQHNNISWNQLAKWKSKITPWNQMATIWWSNKVTRCNKQVTKHQPVKLPLCWHSEHRMAAKLVRSEIERKISYDKTERKPEGTLSIVSRFSSNPPSLKHTFLDPEWGNIQWNIRKFCKCCCGSNFLTTLHLACLRALAVVRRERDVIGNGSLRSGRESVDRVISCGVFKCMGKGNVSSDENDKK